MKMNSLSGFLCVALALAVSCGQVPPAEVSSAAGVTSRMAK